jgi:hypothetical protein
VDAEFRFVHVNDRFAEIDAVVLVGRDRFGTRRHEFGRGAEFE